MVSDRLHEIQRLYPEERWVWCRGQEDLYAVSDQGNIASFVLKPVKLLRPVINSYGYKMVSFPNAKTRYKVYSVHRLVALAFVPGFVQGLHVNHKNAVKTDNFYTNLEWVTHAQNIKHAWDMGLMADPFFKTSPQQGVKHYKATLTEKQARTIYANREHMSVSDLAKRFKVSYPTIYGIVKKRSWKHLHLQP